MEPDTVSTPKINRNTFSFGSGSLLKRVTNNERKITVLKNIIKSQNINIGEKITPTIGTVQESLMATNEVLVDIAGQLEQDFQSRISEKQLLLKQSKSEKLGTRRENFEERIEAKRTQKMVGTAAGKTIKPLKGIFSGLSKFLLLLGGGMIINALVNLEKLNPGIIMENISKVYETIEKHMKLIVGVGAGLIALGLVGTIAGIIAVGSGLVALLSSPLVIAGLGLAVSVGVAKYFGTTKGLGDPNYVGNYGQPTDKTDNKILGETTSVTTKKELGDPNYVGNYGQPTELQSRDDNLFSLFNKNSNKEKNLKIDFLNENTTEYMEILDDQRKEKLPNQFLKPSGNSATKVGSISSFNSINNYMKEVPSLFGFGDLVYT